jgi:hypothetical protein
MTSLTDRYVHVTVRNLDEGQRHDVEQELRGTIEDMVDARLDAGAAASRDDAERAVLVELGDPMRLAAEYTGRPLHLIYPCSVDVGAPSCRGTSAPCCGRAS